MMTLSRQLPKFPRLFFRADVKRFGVAQALLLFLTSRDSSTTWLRSDRIVTYSHPIARADPQSQCPL